MLYRGRYLIAEYDKFGRLVGVYDNVKEYDACKRHDNETDSYFSKVFHGQLKTNRIKFIDCYEEHNDCFAEEDKIFLEFIKKNDKFTCQSEKVML